MSVASILGRVAKLEASGSGAGVALIWQHETETVEQAKARWRAERPGRDDLDRAGTRVIIVRWTTPADEASERRANPALGQ